MLTKNPNMQLKMHVITIEDLVPQDHLLRKIDTLVDFSFIYDEVKSLYCDNNGRPSADPVVLVKYLLVGFLYGISSERRVEQEIQVNMAYRWFLGLDIDKRVPDHSTISQLRRRKFNGTDLFRKIFENIVRQCAEKGLVDGKIIFTDSTHVKANASYTKSKIVFATQQANAYLSRLDEYEKTEREKLESEGKIPPQRIRKTVAEPKRVEQRSSETDPDSGILGRPGKPNGFHYLDHQSIDSGCGIIVDVEVTSGNTNDITPYLERIDYMTEEMRLPIEKVGIDSGYDTSLIHQVLKDKGIEFFAPEANRGNHNAKTEYTREHFSYDETSDTFTCPGGKTLSLRSLERTFGNIMRVYQADCRTCKNCHNRDKCLAPSKRVRIIRVNIFEKAIKQQHAKDGSPEHKEMLKNRQIRSEGAFAAQKREHCLTRLLRRGIEAARTHCLLSATALNIKRMVKYA